MKPNAPPSKVASQRGVAVIEFALVLPLLLLVIAGLAEFGRVIWYYDALAKATRDGARSLSVVVKSDWTDNTDRGNAITAAKTLVVNAAAAANLPALASSNVQVQCDNGSGFAACSSTFPNYVRVAVVNYGVNLGDLFPIITVDRDAWSVTTISLQPYTVMPYMQ